MAVFAKGATTKATTNRILQGGTGCIRELSNTDPISKLDSNHLLEEQYDEDEVVFFCLFLFFSTHELKTKTLVLLNS